jgi:hypothetical protein
MEGCFSTLEDNISVSYALDVKRSYIKPDVYLDQLNRRVYPGKKKRNPNNLWEYYFEKAKVYSAPIDESCLVTFLAEQALEAPIIRETFHESFDDMENFTLYVYQFPTLTDLQLNYVNDLFSVLVEKVKTPYQDIEAQEESGTIDFYFRFNVIAELGMEIYENAVYLTIKTYEPEPNDIFKELSLSEAVIADEDEEDSDVEMDENDDTVVNFDFNLKLIKTIQNE